MPNAGIQAWRSTNWKSALAGSKRVQSSSVSANTSSDTMSAIFWTSGSFSGVSRTNSSTSAPRIGRTINDVTIGNGINLTPQVVAQNQHDADKERRGVGAHGSGLDLPQRAAQPADARGDAVQRAVDQLDVDVLPQP